MHDEPRHQHAWLPLHKPPTHGKDLALLLMAIPSSSIEKHCVPPPVFCARHVRLLAYGSRYSTDNRTLVEVAPEVNKFRLAIARAIAPADNILQCH